MKQISGSTFYFKHLTLIVWCIFAILFTFNVLANGLKLGDLIIFTILPVSMSIFDFFSMKRACASFADKVYDEGSALLFLKDGKKQRVAFKDILDISYSTDSVTVKAGTDGDIGKILVFNPPMSFNPKFGEQFAVALLERVNQVKHTVTN